MTLYKHYAAQYTDLLRALLDPSAFRDVNERTGVGISFAPQGWTLTTNVGRGLPLVDIRRTHPRTAAAEVEWFVSGEKSLSRLHAHKIHVWDAFARLMKGVPVPELVVDTAYGYRWRRHFGRDQLREAVNTLAEEPTSRRVVVAAWDPGADGMRAEQLATPCPFGFSLSTSRTPGGYEIRRRRARVTTTLHPGNNPVGTDPERPPALELASPERRMLNSSLWIRSSDVFVGLPYDVMGHAMLMGLLAAELDMRPGWLNVSLAHPHLYDVHRDMAAEGLEHVALRGTTTPRVVVPHLTLSEVEETPGVLVVWYEKAQSMTEWPAFNPRPEVVNCLRRRGV